MQQASRWILTTGVLLLLVLSAGSVLPQADSPAPAPVPVPAPAPASGSGQPLATDEKMSLERLDELLRKVDENMLRQNSTWQIHFGERALLVITDEKADRMRIMAPIAEAGILNEDLMLRILQANFDSALDARYAVAKGLIWSTFIHPLAALQDDELISAIFQVSTAADNFGTSFSSGMFIYGGGDSEKENRKLLEELQKRLNPVT